jgi:pilus assembly protein CpaF
VAGKTTLLSSLLALVPRTERVLVVEDSRELAPDHPHVVGLEARPPNAELVGAITMTDLVRQSLRMRPDRVVGG